MSADAVMNQDVVEAGSKTSHGAQLHRCRFRARARGLCKHSPRYCCNGYRLAIVVARYLDEAVLRRESLAEDAFRFMFTEDGISFHLSYVSALSPVSSG